MRRRSLFLLLALVLVAVVFVPGTALANVRTGTGQWYWQNPLPQGNYLVDTQFVSATTGWAVGYRGTVLKSTDGGVNWVAQSVGSGSNANTDWKAVSFKDASNGFVCGGNLVMRTINGGTDWIACTVSSDNIDYRYIKFVGSNVFVAGYDNTTHKSVIYQSPNAGDTWDLQVVPAFNDTDPSAGNARYFPNATGAYTFYGMTFADASTGWVVGTCAKGGTSEDIVLYTTNAGTTWKGYEIPASVDANYGALQICSVPGDLKHVWIVGLGGLILRNTDGAAGANGGNGWFASTSSAYGTLQDVSFSSAMDGWAVGYSGATSVGEVVHTTDGGSTWQGVTAGTNEALYGVFAFDSSHAWAVGNGGAVVYTANGGQSALQSVTEDKKRANLWGVSFPPGDTSNGWAVGDNGTIMHTADAGRTWLLQDSTLQPVFGSNNKASLLAVCFPDKDTGYAVGQGAYYSTPSGTNWSWTILKTINGGATWTKLPGPNTTGVSSVNLNDVKFTDDDHGMMVGAYVSGGVTYPWALYTSDGGTSWFQLSQGTALPGTGGILRAVHLAGGASSDAWMTGNIGSAPAVLRSMNWTTDGGGWTGTTTNFPTGVSVTQPVLNDIDFLNANENNGWAVGSYLDSAAPNQGRVGVVLRTTDGGANWAQQSIGSGTLVADLRSVSFADSAHGFIGGYVESQNQIAGWKILASSDGGSGWDVQDPGAGYGLALFKLHAFVDSSNNARAIGVGSSGAIMSTWNPGTSPGPTGLSAPGSFGGAASLANGMISVTLNWTMPTNATGVLVLRSTTEYASSHDAAGFTQVYNANGTTYTDPNMTAGQKYYYTAFATDGTSWSPASNFQVTTPGGVQPPQNVTTSLKLHGAGSVKVKKTYKLTGSVSPSTAGGKVKIALKRLVGKKWKSAGSKSVSLSGGKFSYSFKPTAKGSWRAQATYGGQNTASYIYSTSTSNVVSFKVK